MCVVESFSLFFWYFDDTLCGVRKYSMIVFEALRSPLF